MRKTAIVLHIIFVQAIFLLTLNVLIFSEAYAQDELRFGSTTNLGLLALIAIKENIFKNKDLIVNYKKFQTGKITMDALISEDIDVGTIVDSNVAFINYLKNPIKIIASIATKLDDAIYFKQSNNIFTPKDLIGKRIGFAPATTSHIFLVKFLEKHNIKWTDIKPVILQAPAMESALINGAVDAVSIWQPWGFNIVKSRHAKYGVFENNNGLYPSRILIASTDEVIRSKPVALKKFISSLRQSLKIYNSKPKFTFSYLSPEFGVAVSDLDKLLKPFHFSIQLGSSALPLVQDIGKWISVSHKDFKGQSIPSYEKAFYDHFLSVR
jgi:ABC-type nitrate/sulfonate/bicarbonate transport system substrate-binding protein